jgi:TolA-binding protein
MILISCLTGQLYLNSLDNMNKNLRTHSALLAVTLVLFLAGCSYDNSLYNARKYFNQAQARPLNPQGRPTPQAVDEYMKTITKCGFILTERPNSKEADDALFLLAKALFYRGNSQFQAKDQFQSLIRNFPDSPYIPEAVLYLAKTMRQVNESVEAENLLTAYIRNPKSEKQHPKAILLLADFAVQDKDNIKAQYWLERILTEFKGSVHAKEALFLLGVNLYEQQDYLNSLEQFRRVVSSRGMNRNVKLDSRLYLALNYLHLKELQKSLSIAKRLLRDEDRTDKIPAVRLVIGRILLAKNDETEAIEQLQSIIKANPRTASSAEAYFRLAEYYFYNKSDIQLAIENYNKAKTEFAASPFQPEANRKHAALLQIYQKANIKITDNPQLYVDTKVESAENYMLVMSMPDSAIVMLDNISLVPQGYRVAIDSLLSVKTRLTLEIDSLSVLVDTVAVSIELPDTTAVSLENVVQYSDSLSASDTKHTATSDSISESEIVSGFPMRDSLDAETVEENKVKTGIPETTKTATQNPNLTKLNQLQAELTQVDNLLKDNIEILSKFETEYIPYTKFVKATLIYKTDPESDILTQIYSDMETQFPENKYTLAMKLMLEGKLVRLIDTALEAEEAELDFALSNIATEPDTSLFLLGRLAESTYPNIKDRAIFRLGWHYTFEEQDTTKAKEYLDEILKGDKTTDIAKLVLRFYSGKRFTISFASDTKETFFDEESDSLTVSIKADTISVLADSLKLYDREIANDKQTDEQDVKNSNDTDLNTHPEDDLFKYKAPDFPKVIKED